MEFVKGPASSREELLTRLVAQYEVSLLRTCYMYLHDKGLAEDATQETFLKAYKALADLPRGQQRKDLADPHRHQHLGCDLSRKIYLLLKFLSHNTHNL